VAEGTTGSTVPRRQLGRHLRDLRNGARLTVRAAARELEWSEAKMWRIETGQTSLRSLDVEAMCRVYGAAPELTETLKGLARETKAKGWWHAYGEAVPEGFAVFIGLEEAAAELDCYESELIPGLLQTKEYARAVVRTHNPGLDEAEIERRARLRLERQAVLTRPSAPPRLRAVLNEAVLRRPVDGGKRMADQLRHLLETAELPHVEIRVMPFAAGLHRGALSGPFVLLRFPPTADGRESEPPTVYTETLTADGYVDKPGEVARYGAVFEDMWGAALTDEASRRLMRELAAAYERG
jgi:transcriptional regulator with XRE-family HTH domain